VILVSSLHQAQAKKLPFVFTNSHAYSNLAKYFSAIEDLAEIDWGIIQRRDFKRDEDSDPTKLERYQAEALIYQHLAVDGLLGLVCYSDASKALIETEIQSRRLSLPVYVRPDWYFP
jgi:ssDNA thymidine ADP-ribosyltransferase, DarT